MDEEPDPSGEAVREEVDVDPAEARTQGLASAAARVTEMAKNTQAEVGHPQDPPPCPPSAYLTDRAETTWVPRS